MESHSNTSPADGLELERIAVGPYCIFDAFKPPLSPAANRPSPSASQGKNRKTETQAMNNDFPYAGGVRPSWLTTAADDITLTAVSEDNSTWSEWMQWDPALSQNADMKRPLNVQGPACFLKPEQRPPIFNRRQNSQLREPNLGLQPTDIPTSTPMPRQSSNTPFTFGETVELPPAFDFDGNTLSSPSTGEGQQANGFYSPPMWQQQQHHQQHHSNDSSLFSPPRFGNPPVSASTIGPASTPSLHHSPSSLNNGRTSSSSASPEPAPGNPKKRKSSSEDIDLGPAGKKEKGQPVKKTAHNMIEKRYRTNLNDKIAALRDSVPSLRVMSRQNGGNEEDDDPEDLEGLTPAHKLNKATVLSKATEYIRHLEKRNKRLQDEVTTLKGRVESYEKMAISGPMALHGHIATPDGSRFQEDPFTPSHGMPMPGPPQGMIPVPDSIANLHRGMPPQQHYAPAYPSYSGGATRPGLAGPPLVNGRRNNAMMGKLMVGSLAGLMILEGLVEREQAQEESADKGLFALPPNLASILAPRASFGVGSAQVPIAKLLLIFGAVFYIIAPLFSLKPKSKKEIVPTFALSRAPSLASPVEVRRKAWLTAIQTVWVPRHNFLLEVAALGLKTLKLSTRQIIGWNGYALLTGITKEQEAARVKAWNIALDAQLTGGDAEISKSRLVLTLMASGTLPDTPARLMLKALHIRVLLWQPANQRHGLRMVDDLSAKLARRFWNMARSEHRIAANLASKPDSDAEPLPDHLAALIERECDEVLVPAIIQRAYNLAWNRPSNEKANLDPSMDGVVEDFAISSPLDALAAWYSSHVLKKGLACCLATKKGSTKESVKTDLGLAARTAPPTSQAQLRAIVAQAVVFDNNRAEHIAKALEALPSPLSNSVMNIVGDGSVAADIRKALTFAKCHTLIESSDDEAHRRATFAINNTFLPESTTTLLSFAAGYRVLTRFMQDPTLQTECSAGLERIASSLRMWVGHETGRRSGLSNKVRSRIVNHCLDASKTLVGLAKHEEIDDGYVSSSVKGD